MKWYLGKTPRLVSFIFRNYTWRFAHTKKEIYLTFDDGPTPEITAFVLDTLAHYKARATFFCIGKNCVAHPVIYKQILAANHAIGNHTHNHLNGIKTSTKSYIENVLACEAALKQESGKNFKTNLFRPPYGRIKRSQANSLRKMGYRIIMWSVLSGDFDKTISKEKCLQNVIKNTKNGSIVVFHDSEKAGEHVRFVLPKVLEYFSERGFVFRGLLDF